MGFHLLSSESQIESTMLLPRQEYSTVAASGVDSTDREISVAPPVAEAMQGQLFITPTISVIIPAKNEAKNLPYVLPYIPNWVQEVILVDGNSTDETVAVAKALLAGIRVIKQQGVGKGAALRTGFSAATSEIIVMLDADGSMNPGEIPLYLGALLTGADFAKGSRFLQGGGTHDMGWVRFLGNFFLTKMVCLIHGGQYTDLCYGYNAFWRRILPAVHLDANGFEIETQFNVRVLQTGLRVSEVPSFEDRRIHGQSNLSTLPDGWRVLKTIIQEWLHPQVTLRPRAGEQMGRNFTHATSE